MHLDAVRRQSLSLAGYALAHGVWCLSRSGTVRPTLVVCRGASPEVVPVSADAPLVRAASVIEALGSQVRAAALLTRSGAHFVKVRLWADGQWGWALLLPVRVCEQVKVGGAARLLSDESLSREERRAVLDVVYEGVGAHAEGLHAWVVADGPTDF